MKNFFLLIFAAIPLFLAANISFEEKIDFIIEKQITKDTTTSEIKEITILALEEFDIDLSSLEDFDNYFDPFIAEYLQEMKTEIKELYLDTYSEE